jgi:hypothetical protein
LAASLVPEELSALIETRSRLEAALRADEHWRALQQSAGRDGEADESAARRARNTRLRMALAENPLYQAWKHVNEAIDALRESGARAESAKPAPSAPQAAGGSPSLPLPPPKIPITAGAVRGGGSAGPRARGRADLEPEEATVTFVRREPLLPSAQLPADLGSARASALFDRLRGLEGEPDLREEAFAPPSSDAEEAEVVIVTAEGARERREAEERARTFRRLRKALSGD